MKKQAYIFVDRNMGNGYAFAYPPMSFWRAWMLQKFVIPESDKAMEDNENQLLAMKAKNEKSAFEDGVIVFAKKMGYTVCKLKIMPDFACADPKAKGRNPRFVMYVVISGFPDIISKSFNSFINDCRKIAFETFDAGVNPKFLIKVADSLYPQKKN